MGKRVTFRDRDSRENWSRISFVKGEVTTGSPSEGFVACGPGTAYPMLASLNAIAELFFRVKDAVWGIDGYFSGELDDDAYQVVYPPQTQPSDRAQYEGSKKVIRGYTLATDNTDDSPYLAEGYDAGGGNNHRDITDDEHALWMVEGWDVGMTTAFSFESDDPTGDGSGDYFGGTSLASGSYPWGANATVIFSGSVAYVLDPADPVFFSPLTTFYIGVEFQCFDYAPSGPVLGGSTNLADGDTHVCDYVIGLMTATLRCPFYAASSGFYRVFGEDFVHQATDWWTYATSAGIAAWGAGTGSPVNGGPGA